MTPPPTTTRPAKQPPPILRTRRLILRPPVAADLDGFAAMNADPEVMRHIGAGRLRAREETRVGLEHVIGDWDRKGYGLFSVDSARTGQFLGWVTLAEPLFLPQVLPAVEIGWRFLRAHWGHGYATEAAQATMRFAFDDRGFERLVSIRHVDNHASRRVMEKLGMHQELETTVPVTGQAVVVHTITRDEFNGS
jgi:RimJ/RimL family protein N-acetyltransferase